jgi:hypothetical protein
MASDSLTSQPGFGGVWNDVDFEDNLCLVEEVDLGRGCQVVSHVSCADGVERTLEAEAVGVGDIAPGAWAAFPLSAMVLRRREEKGYSFKLSKILSGRQSIVRGQEVSYHRSWNRSPRPSSYIAYSSRASVEAQKSQNPKMVFVHTIDDIPIWSLFVRSPTRAKVQL